MKLGSHEVWKSWVATSFFNRESCELSEFFLGCYFNFEPRKGTEYTEGLGLILHYSIGEVRLTWYLEFKAIGLLLHFEPPYFVPRLRDYEGQAESGEFF